MNQLHKLFAPVTFADLRQFLDRAQEVYEDAKTRHGDWFVTWSRNTEEGNQLFDPLVRQFFPEATAERLRQAAPAIKTVCRQTLRNRQRTAGK